jgi:hypothetical protein
MNIVLFFKIFFLKKYIKNNIFYFLKFIFNIAYNENNKNKINFFKNQNLTKTFSTSKNKQRHCICLFALKKWKCVPCLSDCVYKSVFGPATTTQTAVNRPITASQLNDVVALPERWEPDCDRHIFLPLAGFRQFMGCWAWA